jgi:hypothetical protein
VYFFFFLCIFPVLCRILVLVFHSHPFHDISQILPPLHLVINILLNQDLFIHLSMGSHFDHPCVPLGLIPFFFFFSYVFSLFMSHPSSSFSHSSFFDVVIDKTHPALHLTINIRPKQNLFICRVFA